MAHAPEPPAGPKPGPTRAISPARASSSGSPFQSGLAPTPPAEHPARVNSLRRSGSIASAARFSSPGSLGSGGGTAGLGRTTSLNTMNPGVLAGPGGVAGDLPRLPVLSESGDRPGAAARVAAPPLLRRSTTVNGMSGVAGRDRELRASHSGSLAGAGGAGPGGPAGAGSPAGRETAVSLKKERNALQSDKQALLLNKRRLEGVLGRLLDAAGAGAGGSGGEADSGLAAALGGRGGNGGLRAALQKALDDSAALDGKLCGGGAAPLGAADDEARAGEVRELQARMADMKLDHEAALSRLEGELAYRRTQAAAAQAGLARQAAEAEGEAGRCRGALAAAEAQIRGLQAQCADLRQQCGGLGASLADSGRQLREAQEALGVDKSTLQTVIRMLKEQLADAAALAQRREGRIQELEYALVARDAALADAAQRAAGAVLAATAGQHGGRGGGGGAALSPQGGGSPTRHTTCTFSPSPNAAPGLGGRSRRSLAGGPQAGAGASPGGRKSSGGSGTLPAILVGPGGGGPGGLAGVGEGEELAVAEVVSHGSPAKGAWLAVTRATPSGAGGPRDRQTASGRRGSSGVAREGEGDADSDVESYAGEGFEADE